MGVKKEILAQGKYLRLVNQDRWEYAERAVGHGVVILVATIENRLLLTQQYRASVTRDVIELPAGLVGDTPSETNETLESAARRELIEETGYSPGKLTFLTEGPPSCGISNEIISFFLAEDLTRVGKGGGDATENITVIEIELDKIEAWAKRKASEGVLIDPKIFAGAYFAMRYSGREKR
jgi:ADP-ribose pyrophosphatase